MQIRATVVQAQSVLIVKHHRLGHNYCQTKRKAASNRSVCVHRMSVRRAPLAAAPAAKTTTRLNRVLCVGLASPTASPAASQTARRYVIVTMGPTGAGKSKLAEESARVLGVADHSVKAFLVDDIVENHPRYKAKVLCILRKLKQGKTDAEFKKLMMNPTAKMYNDFRAAYFQVRKSTPCNLQVIQGNCDDVNDTLIKTELSNGNHVLIEAKGSYDPLWVKEFVSKNANPNYIYTVVYSHVLVNFDQLLDRNKTRAYEAARLFMADPTNNPAPRLPNVADIEGSCDTLAYRIEVTAIKEALKNMLTDPRGRDRALVFDNNVFRRLVYDSDEHSERDIQEVWDKINACFMRLPEVPHECRH